MTTTATSNSEGGGGGGERGRGELVRMPVFFKVRESVKRAIFEGQSLEDLKKVIMSRYYKHETFRTLEMEEFPPLYIISKEAKIPYELEHLEDLYPNCVIEVRLPQLDLLRKRGYGLGYYAFQKQKLCFCMVGLPARGKSYIARKIARYLKWVGVPTQIFNVGSYRRERLGTNQPADFFDPDNPVGNRARLHMAIAALDDMLNWLNKGGRVAIYDATNSTRERRSMIVKRCSKENVQVVFVESVCPDPTVIEKNIRDTKLSSPDYQDKDPEKSIQDFRKRIQQYEKTYQQLDITDSELSYVKIIDIGRQIIINKIESYLPSRVIHFLMNLHITGRPIWFTRHGENEYNALGRIGGDSQLTETGEVYAHALADWVEANLNNDTGESLTVWTSSVKCSIATAQYINRPKVVLKALDEMDVGICAGMTYDQIADTMPDEYAAYTANKLKYKYPQGESYTDVMQRLEPVLFELERQKAPVLVVSHLSVLQGLFAYFLDIEVEEIPFIDIEMHTVYQFTTRAYGTEVQTFKLVDK